MATFTKTNGTTQPVFALDVANGSIAGTANIAAQGPVQPAGPKLDFFQLTANASLATSGNVNGYINNTFQAIQGTGTVAMYQVGQASSQTLLNIAIYPSGADTTATILAAAQTANGTGGQAIGWNSASNAAVFTSLVA